VKALSQAIRDSGLVVHVPTAEARKEKLSTLPNSTDCRASMRDLNQSIDRKKLRVLVKILVTAP
jgi:hypothetical protein